MFFDDELLAEARVVKVPIRGPVTSSRDDIVCTSERRNTQIISGFLATAQEYITERRRPIAARHQGAKSASNTRRPIPMILVRCSPWTSHRKMWEFRRPHMIRILETLD